MSVQRDAEAHGAHHVYRIFSKDGALLYIGCARYVEERIYMHLQTYTMKFAMLIHQHYGHHTSERFPSRIEARAAERAAIQSERPILNHQHNTTRWRRVRGEWVPVDQETCDTFNALLERPKPNPEFADFLSNLLKPA